MCSRTKIQQRVLNFLAINEIGTKLPAGDKIQSEVISFAEENNDLQSGRRDREENQSKAMWSESKLFMHSLSGTNHAGRGELKLG